MMADVTLCRLFQRNAARRPDALALIDPPDREAVTGDAPRVLTYADAAKRVKAIAALLQASGLPPGSVIGIQLPNVAESILAPLALMQAGMIPALLPLLWRRADCVAALAGVHAKALITCSRIGSVDHGHLALQIAADLFPIRAVFSFGKGLPDGVIALDQGAEAESQNFDQVAADKEKGPALITFDCGLDGPPPVPRTQAQLLAAGLLVLEQAAVREGTTLLSTIAASSYAGLAAGMLPWLLTGGTLVLHHPFTPELLGRQIAEHQPQMLALPEAVVLRAREAGLLRAPVSAVLSICRAPERLAAAESGSEQDIRIVDLACFGETALLAEARTPNRRAGHWAEGPVHAGSGEDRITLGEIGRSDRGTLRIRGALAAAPLDQRRQHSGRPDTGWHDTGYPCTRSKDGLVVTTCPPGLVQIGACRLSLPRLQAAVHAHDPAAVLAPFPHAVMGQRLAGHCADPAQLHAHLTAEGQNPLLANAFRRSAR